MLEIVDQLQEGRIVGGRYRLESVVGEGGMGVVWAATHVLTGKACALKFLKESRATEPRSRARMLNEARAACRARHPNIAAVHDILELPSGVPFIVMDLLKGEPLSMRLAAGPMPPAKAGAMLLSIARALDAAHAEGVVHRDLKPENVFLERASDGTDRVFVLDFGIAKLAGAVADRARTEEVDVNGPAALTTTRSTLGTPMYMAPEQMSSSREIDGRCDVWALGMIVVECVTGQRPVRRLPEGGVELREVARSLRRMLPAGSDPFVASVVGMLAIDPHARPSLSAVQATLTELAATTPTASASAVDRRAPRRPVKPFGIGLVGALLACTGVAAFASRTTMITALPLTSDVVRAASASRAPEPGAGREGAGGEGAGGEGAGGEGAGGEGAGGEGAAPRALASAPAAPSSMARRAATPKAIRASTAPPRSSAVPASRASAAAARSTIDEGIPARERR